MAVLTTSTGVLELPKQKIEPWTKQIAAGSCIATLSAGQPMIFGPGQAFTFDVGEAEYVGEGANKGASTITPSAQTVTPYKFHKTVRMTNEIMWADEDDQLDALDQILAKIQPALSRALDYGVLHGINPTGGAAVAAMTQRLTNTTNVVTLESGKPYTYLDAADALIWLDEDTATKVVASAGVVSAVAGLIAGGLGVAYRPTR